MRNSIQNLLNDVEKGVFNDFYKKDVRLSLDYSYTDVLRIEKYINHRIPSGGDAPSHLIIALGVYLGNIIIKQIGGEWTFDENDNISEIAVNIKSEGDINLSLKPLIRVANYIEDRENSIEGWYYLIKRYCSGQINVDKLEYDKWYDNAGKGGFRIVSAR